MGKQRRQCLQFIIAEKEGCGAAGLLIEQLRYAGLLTVVKESDTEQCTFHILQIKSPHGVDNAVWIAHNEERMRSFGLNVAALYE